MDEVEAFLAVQPCLGEVVDLEAQIRGHHGGLGGAEVGAEDLGVLRLGYCLWGED